MLGSTLARRSSRQEIHPDEGRDVCQEERQYLTRCPYAEGVDDPGELEYIQYEIFTHDITILATAVIVLRRFGTEIWVWYGDPAGHCGNIGR